MRDILVIGGNRYFGRIVATILGESDHVLCINRSGGSPPNCASILTDRSDLKDMQWGDVIFDFCCYNADQMKHTLKNTDASAKYIFISSGAVYDESSYRFSKYSSANGINRFGEYGVGKRTAELCLYKNRRNSLIIRPPYVVGGNDKSNRLETAISVARMVIGDNVVINQLPDNEVSLISDVDCAAFICDAYKNSMIGITNTHSEIFTARTLVEEIIHRHGDKLSTLKYDESVFKKYIEWMGYKYSFEPILYRTDSSFSVMDAVRYKIDQHIAKN